MLSADCVIVGAGLAGAATAYQLAQRGMRELVILDREAHAGFHSSSRNAAMLRAFVEDEALLPLAIAGARFIRSAQEQWSQGEVFRPGGSCFSASGARWRALCKSLELAQREVPGGLEAEIWDASELERRVPATRGGGFEGAIHTPSDGSVDVHRLLHGYLAEARRAGARIRLSSEVTSIHVDAGHRVERVDTAKLSIATPRVVNASGAWAPSVAALAGACPIPFTALRRHLVYTGPYALADPSWPYVWDLDADLYFRPESTGLLLSPCDETSASPGVPDSDPAALELLYEKLSRSFPALANLPVARSWAGLRVFAPDRRFVIGRDPYVSGFYWATGLGGHGVTTSAAVGALVADEIVAPEGVAPHAFSPSRFVAAEDSA
jgi:D-arginine dehydrogenase